MLSVRIPGVATRAYPVPVSCEPEAVAPGTVFVACYGPTPTLQEFDIATGALRPVTVGRLSGPGSIEDFSLARAGTHWLEGEMRLSSETSPSGLYLPVIVNRRTGGVIDLDGRFNRTARRWGVRRYVDLSSARPDRTLCTPVRRTGVLRGDEYLRLTKIGAWTLREALTPQLRRHRVLQRCGTRRAMRLPPNGEAVLGRGFAAWFDRRVIRLRNLRTGRTRAFTWYGPRTPYRYSTTFAFISNRLVVSQNILSNRTYVVHTIPLR